MRGEVLVDEGLVEVLGTTTVDGEHVTPRQRGLLAALALSGPAGAEIDALADAVWGGRPPRSARSALQNQMTRLRRGHGEDLILCVGTRYRLGRATDAMRFEQEVAAAAAAEPATRIALLAAALGRWRGTPFTDIDSHAADVARAGLREVRAHAVERLASARLDVGALEDCIRHLREEIELDPYRDRVWELLVIAFGRAGRLTEALAAIEEYRRRLHREFGVDPTEGIAVLRSHLPVDRSLAGSRPSR